MFERAKGLIVTMIALLVVAILIHPLAASAGNVSLLAADTPLRFLGALLIGGLAFAAFYSSGDRSGWEIDTRLGIIAVVAAVVSGVVQWLLGGETFPLPAFEQVTLLAALVPVVLFALAFGPIVGFAAGAGGSMLANLFAGWVLPQVDFAMGLAGLLAGFAIIWSDTRSRHTILSIIALASGGVISAATFLLAGETNVVVSPPGTEPQTATLLLALSAFLAAGLAAAVRFAFPGRPRWGYGVAWGAVGAFGGLLARAAVLLLTDGLTFAEAFFDELLPLAGPAVLAIAILAPAFLALSDWYNALPEDEGN